MRATTWALAAVVFAVLPACSSTPKQSKLPASAAPASAAMALPTEVANIPILPGKSLKSPVRLLGFIDAGAEKGQPAAMASLRQKAAVLGADAIINLEYHAGAKQPARFSGVAVKYRHHRAPKPE